jgi:hypothetical protein
MIMEIIREYLNSMFASLKDTPEVRKARTELMQMMEDKYNELISEGCSQNEAVGTVISEFGNLDELADELGVSREVKETKQMEDEDDKEYLTVDDAEEYIEYGKKRGLNISIAILLFICSVISPIVFDNINEGIGSSLMFVIVAVGVFFLLMGHRGKQRQYYYDGKHALSKEAANYVKDKRLKTENVAVTYRTIGIMLCILSVGAEAFLEECIMNVLPFLKKLDMDGVLFFVLIGFGVFFITLGGHILKPYVELLNLNRGDTVFDNYIRREAGSKKYISSGAEFVMDVFWPTVVCVYLIVSFLTFEWATTWIIFVLGALLKKLLMVNLVVEEDV